MLLWFLPTAGSEHSAASVSVLLSQALLPFSGCSEATRGGLRARQTTPWMMLQRTSGHWIQPRCRNECSVLHNPHPKSAVVCFICCRLKFCTMGGIWGVGQHQCLRFLSLTPSTSEQRDVSYVSHWSLTRTVQTRASFSKDTSLDAMSPNTRMDFMEAICSFYALP